MKRTQQQRRRLGILIFGMLVFFVVVGLRLGQLQIVHASEYEEKVECQSSGKVAIPAERGMIFDRYGRPVAKNVKRSSLYAYPETYKEMAVVASYLEDVLSLTSESARGKYHLEPKRFRWIKRRIDDAFARRVAREATRGLYLREEATREYPFDLAGKQILGFTNIDGQGLAGIEWSWDSVLAGQNGWVDIRRDGLRNTYRVKETALVKPVPGRSLVLTVDWQMQAMVEEELRGAIEKFNAEHGMAAFIDCNSGDILAIAHHEPDIGNPAKPDKLCAVTDQFEPGSVFKAFTATALLNNGLINFSDSIYCEMGCWKVGRRRLHDDKELGWLSFREVIELSSNIGLGKCAIQTEGQLLIDTYRQFGFGTKPGSGLPGETAGRLALPRTWSDYNVSALAMGHSVAVSVLQMACAMGAIANGGELLRPHLILGLVDDNGYVQRTTKRDVVARPVRPSAIDSLRAMLRGVVENGTAQPVNSELVSISGKTGTAEIPNLEHGGYYKNRFMASFCGYFPSETPVVAGIVVLRDPHPITYGGHTAGVAFRKIAQRYCATNPDLLGNPERTLNEHARRLDITVETPDFVGKPMKQVREIAASRRVEIRSSVAEGTVAWQFPPPDRQMLLDDEMLLSVIPPGEESPCMIDLRGITIRRAVAFLDQAGIKITVRGSGIVRRQSIRPGGICKAGSVCVLECRSL